MARTKGLQVFRKNGQSVPNQPVFTTGQVAKICRVAPRTVSKWFDAGRLKGYRIPGSEDRRVPREQLIAFLKVYKMPIPLELNDVKVVLLVGLSAILSERVVELLSGAEPFRVEVVEGLFDAGLAAHELRPVVVVVDGSIGRGAMEQVAAALVASRAWDMRLVAVVSADWASADTMGYDDVLVDPVDPAVLVELIRSDGRRN